MLDHVALGSLLVVVTTFIHAGFMLVAFKTFEIGLHDARVSGSQIRRVTFVAALVLLMFFAAIVESGVWALTYLAVGAISSLDDALYFSMVTFTTLGFGDVVIHSSWRRLASFEAANGTMMFGWTTALIVAAAHHLYFHVRSTSTIPRDHNTGV